MSQSKPLSHSQSAEYAAIEAAMIKTEKGRGFLKDYLERNRTAETGALLDAIGKVQTSLSDRDGEQGGELRLQRLRQDLSDLSSFLTRARRDLAAMAPAYAAGASGVPRQVAGVIIEAANAAESAAGLLRRSGADKRLIEEIERQLEAMRLAARVVEMNRLRSEKLSGALAHVEAEIMASLDSRDLQSGGDEAAADAKGNIGKALKKRLIEELAFAMLSANPKSTLVH